MIYKNKHLKKELSFLYDENKFNFNKVIKNGGFLALLAFSLHFMFQTMYESVLTEVFPEFMLPSYFSSIYMYTLVSFIYFVVVFVKNYTNYTFAEIKENDFYVLNKMGYSTTELIFNKLEARYLTLILTYTLGFVLNLLATSLLSYAFVPDYFFPLYLMGLIDILVVVTVTLTNSLYVEGKQQSIIAIVGSAVGVVVVKILSNYYDIVSNRVLMQNISNMFDIKNSIYIPAIALTFGICIILCLSVAHTYSRYCTVTPLENEEDYYSLNKQMKNGILIKRERAATLSKAAKVFNVGIIICVSIFIAFNSFILIISATQNNKDGSIGNVIPLVFQSTTMEPHIIKNDLVFLTKIDVQEPLKVGDIVRYKYNNINEIGMVMEITPDHIITNITNYPEMAEKDVMKRTLNRYDIDSRHAYTNRYLGALILFANTIFGRILMLLIPTILIFYHKQIINLINKISSKNKKKSLD
ncbi:MAG: hypothetical protein RR458_04720 [Clostridia bacterium]